MKSLIKAVFFLFPFILLAQNETFDVRHTVTFKKESLKNTAQIEGIRFFDLDANRTLFIHGNFDGVYGHNFSTSWGSGIRNHFSQFGLGINAYWDFSNESQFSIHQIGLGAEFMFERFTFFYNRNIPLSKARSQLLYKVHFSHASQIGFKHAISRNLYYALSLNFRADTPRIGAKFEIHKQFNFGFTLGAFAIYEGNQSPKGGISIGYHFGGSKPSKYKKAVRDHQIKYRVMRAKIQKIDDQIIIIPPPEPPQSGKKNGWFSAIFG